MNFICEFLLSVNKILNTTSIIITASIAGVILASCTAAYFILPNFIKDAHNEHGNLIAKIDIRNKKFEQSIRIAKWTILFSLISSFLLWLSFLFPSDRSNEVLENSEIISIIIIILGEITFLIALIFFASFIFKTPLKNKS